MRQMHLLTAAEAVACSGSQCFVLLCNIDQYWHALDLSVLGQFAQHCPMVIVLTATPCGVYSVQKQFSAPYMVFHLVIRGGGPWWLVL